MLGDNMKNDLPNDYEINEADIDKILRHLKLAHPEDTITPEMAIDKLDLIDKIRVKNTQFISVK